MTDDVHERIGFREIDEQGNSVRAVSPNAPEPIDASPRRLLVNPFVVALWLLDLALGWFTIWAFSAAIEGLAPSVASPMVQYNFILLSAAPYGALAAILLTAALLFWHAAQWQKKRPTRSP
ncbi:hypothetical protein [Paenarthrobacter sp. NPDC058040]|uniref:hypothetical protein n=1 Tax=unclassified Paenarthrobacter TaxID=2634190 RepID=UPI0036D85CAC